MTVQPTSLPVRSQTSEAWRQGMLAGACLWSSALTLLQRWRSASHALARRVRNQYALRQLDSHLLADIGLTRSEIEFMRQGDWRFPSWQVPRGD